MRSFFFVLFFIVSSFCNAQSVSDMWINIPDTFVPYFTANHRKEMIECNKIGVDSSVKNKLDGKSEINELTDDYGCFVLSEAKEIQIIRLPYTNDSIFCYVETFITPERQSRMSFFDRNWREITSLEKNTLPEDLNCFCQRPDTMSVDDYNEIINNVTLKFVEYKYSCKDKTLQINMSFPLLSTDERQKLDKLISKKSLIWNGSIFN